MTYQEKLKDPRWQRRRLEIFQRDDFICQLCSDKETTLHIHHIYYIKGAEPWDHPDDALITYCEVCHTIVELFKTTDIKLPIIQILKFTIKDCITVTCILKDEEYEKYSVYILDYKSKDNIEPLLCKMPSFFRQINNALDVLKAKSLCQESEQ